jgi:arabinan endo-1,5-alpha-L-arabinosidase
VLKYAKSAGLLACIALCSLAPVASAATTGDNGSHDPSRMIACEGKVYIYSTGGGAKSSSDGLNWQNAGSPSWNRNLLANNQGIWAPDGLFLNGKYLLYGSMWNDSKASALVLLTSPTLNPDSPNYKWTDAGVVVAGPSGVTHSVIDPAPVLDTDGSLYVVWGGGYPFATTANSIFLTRMDSNTGLALTTDAGYKPPDQPGYVLEQGHKEGPYIHPHAGNYFLFYQTGGCCSGTASTYTIHVARATSIKGPYSGDRTFYASTGNVHGPGHMGVYSQCGEERFTYHFYPDNGSIIGENELVWGADGWPTVGAEATTPLKICDATAGGVGGSSGTGGSSSMAGASGSAAGGSSSGGTAAGGGDTGGQPPTSTSGGVTNSAGMSNISGSVATGGALAAGGSSQLGTAGNALEGTPADAADAGCSCSMPHKARSGLDRAVWLALAALGLVARRRRAAELS